MALPTLDAVFASAADLPRRMVLAKWLVEELGETAAPSSVLVSGLDPFGEIDPNGKYSYVGEDGGKPRYEKNENQYIFWSVDAEPDAWELWAVEERLFVSTEDAAYPWLVTNWTAQEGTGDPVITEISTPSPLSNYYDLPERYLWAKIAVAAGAPRGEADYISLPKQYAWKAIYDAVSGSSLGTIDWSEKQALGYIAAAYRGDTGNPANLATYIDWPWRYQVASIITSLVAPTTYNAVIVSGAGTSSSNGTYQFVEISGNGKAQYAENGTGNSVGWDGLNWNIYDGDLNDDSYRSSSDTEFPWQATGWTAIGGSNPVPTLTPTNV